jgi:hypothetical protein
MTEQITRYSTVLQYRAEQFRIEALFCTVSHCYAVLYSRIVPVLQLGPSSEG